MKTINIRRSSWLIEIMKSSKKSLRLVKLNVNIKNKHFCFRGILKNWQGNKKKNNISESKIIKEKIEISLYGKTTCWIRSSKTIKSLKACLKPKVKKPSLSIMGRKNTNIPLNLILRCLSCIIRRVGSLSP